MTRVPPGNVEAEQAVIGAVLVNNAAWHAVGSRLAPEHFVEEIHRRIWQVASTMIREGRVASPVTLKTFLGDHDLGGITVPQYLARLAAEATTVLNAPDYARMIIDLAARRRVITVAQEVVDIAFDAPVDHPVERIVEDAEAALMEVRSKDLAHAVTSRVDAAAAAAELLAKVDRIRAGERVGQGVTTGIPGIDQDTGGMRPGDLWVVAGRASMGKTIMATTLARAAARSGAGTLAFPFEIGREQAAARILSDLAYSARAPLGYGRIMKGSDIDEEDRWRLEEAQQRLAAMPLVFDTADGATLAMISARVRSERDRMARRGIVLGVVVLDYLNFIKASDRYQGQRHNEIGEISIALKRMATSLGICVVLLAQVNRQTEQREDKRPQISDLKDSGSLEQDADVVALMYRDNYYIERSPAYLKGDPDAVCRANDTRNEIEVIIGKNRIGATRSHKLWCDVSCSIISAQARGGL